MKLLTLNTHSYLEKNPMEKLEYLTKIIIENGYDVIALQEINQLSKSPFVIDEIKESNFLLLLSKRLAELGVDYNFKWDFHHIGYDIYDEGTGILYKGNEIEHYSDYLGKCKDSKFWKTRKFTMVSLKINEEIIDFYSCHLGWWKDEENPFEMQMEQLINLIKKRGNRAFLMGDFNNDANTEDEGYDYLLKSGLFDTYNLALQKDRGITVPGIIDGWHGKSSLPKRIDLILTNKPIEVEFSKVIFNGKNKEIISDHFGVEIGLK